MLQMDNIMAEIQAIMQLEDASVERLGESEIEGRSVLGYHSRIQPGDSPVAWQGKGTFTVWADAESLLPVRLELFDQMIEMTTILDHITINPNLNTDLFSMEAPEGYTVLEKSETKDKTPAEESGSQVDLAQTLVQGFRSWSELSGGTFPSELGVNAVKDLDPNATFGFRQKGWGVQMYFIMPSLRSKINRYYMDNVPLTEQEERGKGMFEQRLNNTWKLFFNIHSLSVPWHYAGAGVRVGQDNTPVFWYQPVDAETYRVIYADLSVADVDPADLPDL